MKFHVKDGRRQSPDGKKMSLALRIQTYESFEVFRNNEKAVGCPDYWGLHFHKIWKSQRKFEIARQFRHNFVHATNPQGADEGKNRTGKVLACILHLEKLITGKILPIFAKGKPESGKKKKIPKKQAASAEFNGVSVDPSNGRGWKIYRKCNIKERERQLFPISR